VSVRNGDRPSSGRRRSGRHTPAGNPTRRAAARREWIGGAESAEMEMVCFELAVERRSHPSISGPAVRTSEQGADESLARR
jgi:hypothetical protein